MSKFQDATLASQHELEVMYETHGGLNIKDCWRIAFNLDESDMIALDALLYLSIGSLHSGAMKPESVLFSVANIGKHLERLNNAT